jgi:2-polyprenyl-6-methoxyphenol hydroxylase-like FAD-dependent oxidoreductase
VKLQLNAVEAGMRILVCGAGPTGLTLALELARRGIKADIIERRAQPSQLSRAVGLMPGSMRIFEPTGVAEAIRAQAIEVQRARFHDGSKLVATLNLTVLPDPA